MPTIILCIILQIEYYIEYTIEIIVQNTPLSSFPTKYNIVTEMTVEKTDFRILQSLQFIAVK